MPTINFPGSASSGLGAGLSAQQKILSTQGEKSGTKFKVALKPGHSPMDWARTSAELARTNKRSGYRNVTKSELVRHNKKTDMWMAYEGIVYDVTKYVEFHPGGVEEILRGKGRDGTALFNEVHSWVNLRNMLKSCTVGQLVEDPLPGPVKFSSKREKEQTEIEIELDCNPFMAFFDTVKCQLHCCDQDFVRLRTVDIFPKDAKTWSGCKFTDFNKISLSGSPNLTTEISALQLNYQRVEHLQFYEVFLKDKIQLEDDLKIYEVALPVVPIGNSFNDEFSSASGGCLIQEGSDDCAVANRTDGSFISIPHVSLQDRRGVERPYSVVDSNHVRLHRASAGAVSFQDEGSWLTLKLLIKNYKDGAFTKTLEDGFSRGEITSTLFNVTTTFDHSLRPKDKPNYVLFGGGTGVAPFLDLARYENVKRICYWGVITNVVVL